MSDFRLCVCGSRPRGDACLFVVICHDFARYGTLQLSRLCLFSALNALGAAAVPAAVGVQAWWRKICGPPPPPRPPRHFHTHTHNTCVAAGTTSFPQWKIW